MKKIILLIEDEKDIVELIAFNLEVEGYKVLKAYEGYEGLEMAKKERPNLIILDLMLPGIQGLEICKMIRSNSITATIPIIILTAKSDPLDKILGLEIGADDYMTKPFHVRELIARVRAALRRMDFSPLEAPVKLFSYKGLSIDYGSYTIIVDGNRVDLGPTEIKLLFLFAQNHGRVYSRDQLLDRIWGDETFVEPRTVDVHISRLRKAIERDKENPDYILTVRGIGYKLNDMK
jgi:DNA-binding response OmpR family regulator